MTTNGRALCRFILKLKKDMQMNNLLLMPEAGQAGNGTKPHVSFSCRVLSWLLHHANREGRNEYLYKIKNRLLSKYGKFIGHDIQFIEGKKCHSCDGTGIYVHYHWHGSEREYEGCYRCYNGWYKRPTWNVLQRIQFGNYVFHQPFERLYKKPEDVSLPIIEGYIEHNRSKHGKFALTILFLLYEKGYLKRWYKSAGIGWKCYWWQPRNWLYNIVHIIKHGRNSIPFNDTKRKMKAIISKYKSVKPVSYEPDDLPF